MLNKLFYKIVKTIFQRRFKYFEYPFTRADEEINKLTKDERDTYYFQAQNFRRSKVFQIEFESLIRKFYQELAVKSQTDVEVAGYRLTLLFIQRLNQRLDELSTRKDLTLNSISEYKKYAKDGNKTNKTKATSNSSDKEGKE